MNTFTKLAVASALTLGVSTATMASDDWTDSSKDAWIDGKAEATLLFNTNLNSFNIETDVKDVENNINVDVANGEVSLIGTVESDAERDLAVEIAENTDDVIDVIDKLEIIEEDDSQEPEYEAQY
jgi:osmotically-inducible protein OsmY